MYIPGTGRVCTGEMSSSETLRRISSREGQNTKPLLVFSTSESRHQYVEPVGVYRDVTLLCLYGFCKGTKVTVSSFLIQKLILKRIKVLQEMTIQ